MEYKPIVVILGGAGREGVLFHLLRQGLPVVALGLPIRRRPDRAASLGAAEQAARHAGVPVLNLANETLVAELASYAGAILLNVGGEFYLDREVRGRFAHCLNLHPTLLPKYRGAASIAHVILNRDTHHGSTAHLMDDGIDTGPIVAQREFLVSPCDTYATLQRKAYALEPELAVEALTLLCSGRTDFRPQPAGDDGADWRRTPEDSRLDPTRPLLDLVDLIRASDPERFPAFFEHEGQRYEIHIKIF